MRIEYDDRYGIVEKTDGSGFLVKGNIVTTKQLVSTETTAALTQTEWYIDGDGSYNGNDANDGNTEIQPLRTISELMRRLGTNPRFEQSVTITILSDIPTSEKDWNIDFIGANKAKIKIVCRDVVVLSGTFSALTTKDELSGTPWQATSSSLGSYVNDHLWVPSRSNATAWITKDQGGGSVRLSEPMIPITLDGRTHAPTKQSISNGDAFEVRRAARVNIGSIRFTSMNGGGGENDTWLPYDSTLTLSNVYCVRDSSGTSSLDSLPVNAWSGGIIFERCRFDVMPNVTGYANFENCGLALGIFGFGTLVIRGGMIKTLASFTGYCILDGDIIVGGAAGAFPFIRAGQLTIGAVGVFDTSMGLRVDSGGTAKLAIVSYVDDDGVIWGTVTSNKVNLRSCGKVFYTKTTASAALPVTSSATQFTLSAKSTIPAFNEASGTYTEARTVSIANLDLAVASGGFAGSAIDPATGTGVIKGATT